MQVLCTHLTLPFSDSECVCHLVICTHSRKRNIFSSCDRKFWPVTLTFKNDLDSVQLKQIAKYLHERLFSSKVIVPIHRHTHTTDRLLDLIYCYKIVFGLTKLNFVDFFEFSTLPTRGHAYKLFKPRSSNARVNFLPVESSTCGMAYLILSVLLV